MITVQRSSIRLKADPQRVLPRFLNYGEASRYELIIQQVASLEERTAVAQLEAIYTGFEDRHFDLKAVFLKHYQKIGRYASTVGLSLSKQLLIGACFTHEYSVEAAALFNPSIVPHLDQRNLPDGDLRFILSLRATGEGHISSIEFKTGVIGADGTARLEPSGAKLSAGRKVEKQQYSKGFVISRAEEEGALEVVVKDALPEQFSEQDALAIISQIESASKQNLRADKEKISAVFGLNYELSFEEDTPISSRVIFPSSKSESNGIEDARFVQFRDEDKEFYLGTYTAYNGKAIRPQVVETDDFRHFRIRPLYGKAASNKGMALFPEKINGQYAMIGRQGGRSLSIMYSDSLYFWPHYALLQQPERDWELLQLGNCGSPVKTPYGWLLLTHAVGAMRKYVLSFTLLSLEDPSIVLASLDQPFLSPNEEEREGYVPNVLYTCGMIQHRENLVIPYAMSDRAISFAVVKLEAVIRELLGPSPSASSG